MTTDATLWTFIADAGVTVKFVMLLLVTASLFSWTIIFQRGMLLNNARKNAKLFEKQFWSGIDVNKLFDSLKNRRDQLTGMENIFYSGFDAFLRMQENGASSPDAVTEAVGRAMRVAVSRERDRLEQHLGFLATVGSTSPYVGLFGTVWGIMTAFQSLGKVEQATISMVAPGISEALIATAMGLFAAIPAVIAYNRYSNELERINNMYDNFQEEFIAVMYRQAHAS